MMRHTKITVFLPFVAVLALTSCQPPTHPNQINDFDGKTYDSLLLTHGALASLRENIRISHPDFIPAFNATAHAYTAAFDAYSIYRIDPQRVAPTLSSLVSDLALNVQKLEHDLTDPLPVEPAKKDAVRERMALRRGRMAASRPRYEMSLVDILTTLETGAQIAKFVPIAAPYADLAVLVIDATKRAVGDFNASSGKLIDLALLAPIAPI